MRKSIAAIVLMLAPLFGTTARGQSFPATFAPLYCQRGYMVDGYRDQSGAIDDRDIVGTTDRPAGYRAVDGQFLYFRLRLDGSPVQGNGLTQFAWGFEVSTDGDPTNYEILIAVDGAAGTVSLYSNSVTTVPDSPADPADQLIVTYPFAQNGRVVDAGASIFAGGNDTFLDMAVPWSDLAALGLDARPWSPSGRRRRPTRSPERRLRLSRRGWHRWHPKPFGEHARADRRRSSAQPGAGRRSGRQQRCGGGNFLGSSGIEGGPGCNCGIGGGADLRATIPLILLGVGVSLRRRRRDASGIRIGGR